jgi:hypothetical protein
MRFSGARIKSAMLSKHRRLGLLLILLLLASFPSRPQEMNKPPVPQAVVREQCIANLKGIYDLIKHYLHHTAGVLGFPPNLDEIHSLSEPNLFICPGDKQIGPRAKADTFQTSYEIVNDPLNPKLSTTPAARIAIITEKRANHDGKRFVLFYDGSVRGFEKSQFDKLKNNSFILTDVLP